jgi:hypothetical protein
MPYIVNWQPVPEELIREEGGRIGRDPRWQGIPEEAARATQIRSAAVAGGSAGIGPGARKGGAEKVCQVCETRRCCHFRDAAD